MKIFPRKFYRKITREFKQPTRFSVADNDLKHVPWCPDSGGYAIFYNGGQIARSHRIVLERKIGRKLRRGEMPDHKNRIRNDNRRSNLRVATSIQNCANSAACIHAFGATFNKKSQTWQSMSAMDGRVIFLGSFKTSKEAQLIYRRWHKTKCMIYGLGNLTKRQIIQKRKEAMLRCMRHLSLARIEAVMSCSLTTATRIGLSMNSIQKVMHIMLGGKNGRRK